MLKSDASSKCEYRITTRIRGLIVDESLPIRISLLHGLNLSQQLFGDLQEITLSVKSMTEFAPIR